MKKRKIITILIILGVIIFSILIINKPYSKTSEKTAKCIGKNAILYIQLGCHACQIQENIFGKNYDYLNVVDCFYERDKCTEIKATPTWIINKKEYRGVQSIEKLKELTGC